VNHGPFLVDNNLLLSQSSIRTQSQGGAFVNNLVAGTVHVWAESSRFTPYFLPHSTDIAGLSTIYFGDDRYYNNVFIGNSNKNRNNRKYKYGLEEYNDAKIPVFINENIYYNGANPYKGEKNKTESRKFNPGLKIVEEGDNVFLHITFDDAFIQHKTEIITTDILGSAKVPHAKFENRNGTPLKIDKDYFGKKRTAENIYAGPFNKVTREKMVIQVW